MWRSFLLSLVILVPAAAAVAEPVAGLRPVATVPLPGVEGRFDHFDADVARHRLYVAALGNNTMEVVDLSTNQRVGSVKGFSKPCGIRVMPNSGNVVIASGEDGKVRVFSPELKPLGVVGGLDDADNVRVGRFGKLAYVGYGDGALAIIDPQVPKKLGQIKLDGHPEAFQMEMQGRRAFVNVPDAKHVAVINVELSSVIAKWPLPDAEQNFPMALDEANHRLFIGCRKPAKLLVLDTETGKTVAAVDCAGDADDLFYDAQLHRVYVSGGAGQLTIIRQTDRDHYQHAGTINTAPGARTCFFVPSTGRLYLAVPHRGEQPAEIRVFERDGT